MLNKTPKRSRSGKTKPKKRPQRSRTTCKVVKRYSPRQTCSSAKNMKLKTPKMTLNININNSTPLPVVSNSEGISSKPSNVVHSTTPPLSVHSATAPTPSTDKSNYQKLEDEIANLEKTLNDPNKSEKEKEDATIKLEKKMSEIAKTTEFKQQVVEREKEWHKKNDELNEKALNAIKTQLNELDKKMLDVYNKNHPWVKLINSDKDVIKKMYSNDFDLMIPGSKINNIGVYRAIYAALPVFNKDQTKQNDYIETIKRKIDELNENQTNEDNTNENQIPPPRFIPNTQQPMPNTQQPMTKTQQPMPNPNTQQSITKTQQPIPNPPNPPNTQQPIDNAQHLNELLKRSNERLERLKKKKSSE